MYREEQRKRILNLLSNFAIWLFEALSFGFVWNRYYHFRYYRSANIMVFILYIICAFLITKSFNGYKISYMRTLDLCLSHILAVTFSGMFGYAFVVLVWRSFLRVRPMIYLACAQVAFAAIWVWCIKHIYLKFYPPRRIIIIYGNYPLKDFIKKLHTRTDKYEICEILNYQKGFEKICNDVLDFEGVFLYDLPTENRNEILKYCYKNSIRTYVVPKITDIIMKGSDNFYLVDTPLLLSRNMGLNIDQRIIKRTMDIICSILGIIISAPIMLIIALLVKGYDGGPVFYRQDRLTKDGKVFRIFKFRSMRIDAESDGAQLAKKNDNRVTPIGKVLRNLHLDELPQLFNVFMGDMAIVGPRPERPEIFEKYEKNIPEFPFRLKVKAGITGYAQVYGKYNTTPIDKLKLDLTYIQEFSFWLDIKLMLLTFRIVFRKETSEGVDSSQTTALKEEISENKNKK